MGRAMGEGGVKISRNKPGYFGWDEHQDVERLNTE